jgi:glycosyltransferase involved in cell wall biosynthesis
MAQTYQNWEYVIVNNCSTDRTQEIAKKYAQQESRIRIHNNHDFVGMSENHNVALRQMSPDSKYCKFVHADDWLLADCLRQMVELAEAHPSVAIVGAYGLKGTKVVWDGLPHSSTVVSGREVCRRTLMGGFYVFGSQTSHLIRADLVRNRSEVYSTHELHRAYADQETCYELLKSRDFGFIHQVLTFSRDHEDSMTSSFAKTGLNIDYSSYLNLLTTYGPIYLTPDQYAARIRTVIGNYYRFLARSLFKSTDKRFWDFHKKALSHIGYPYRTTMLIKGVALEAADALLNPKQILATVLSRLKRLWAGRLPQPS